MLVVLVSTARPGARDLPDASGLRRTAGHRPRGRATFPTVEEALAALDERAVRALRRSPRPPRVDARLVHGAPGELDVELVDRLGHDGISYTPDRDEAVRRVESGDADCAFLLRPTRIEDVFERARRGEVMPQKTTYFFPKLVSGLLFHPVDP